MYDFAMNLALYHYPANAKSNYEGFEGRLVAVACREEDDYQLRAHL